MKECSGKIQRPGLKTINLWLNMSISMKTLILQTVLFVFPLAVCVILFFSFTYLDILQRNAQKSYEYGRYAMDSFEADMLRIKSISNVIASNQQTLNLLTVPQSAMEGEIINRVNILISGTADNHTKVEQATLYATENACEAAQKILPLWDRQKGYSTGWKFQTDENGRPCIVSWTQVIYKDMTLVGVIEIQLINAMLPDMAGSIGKIIGGSCIVQNRAGDILCISGKIDESALQTLQEQSYSEGYQALSRTDYAVMVGCNAMDINFLAIGSVKPSFNIISSHMEFLICVVSVFLLLTAVLIWLNHIGITKRIKQLNAQISRQSQIKQLDSLQPVTIPGNDEIGMLAQNYNIMQSRLIELAEREKAAQIMQQTARFSALQAQIQPHFLYNTLETLRMMADEHDDMEVADMIFVLGKLMRNSISGKEQEIELNKELENVQNYLLLNQLRYENLRFEICCDVDISSMKCPRFILQPLVENSIHHGISKKRTDGFLRIHIYEENGDYLVGIEDNGMGILTERLEEIQKSLIQDTPLNQEQGGIGIVNVHRRLKIYFGERSGLEIQSEFGKGTICRICMQRKEGDEPM